MRSYPVTTPPRAGLVALAALSALWLAACQAASPTPTPPPPPPTPTPAALALDDNLAAAVKTDFSPTDRLTVADDAAEKKSGQNSLRLTLSLRGNNAVYLYQAPTPQDWSAYQEISFWWYGDKMGVVSVDILSPDWENYYHLTFVDDWEGWRQVRLPLAQAAPGGKNPSWKAVKTLSLKFQSLPASGTVRIDDIRFSRPG